MHKWNALDYQKNSGVQLAWGKELIAKLGLRGNEHVLDIGCGDGKVTAGIAANVPGGLVTGIDNSREMINLARRTFPSGDFPNLLFIHMDARRLTFVNEFDVVFSNAVLHWVDDHCKVLSGIAKSLKAPGRILLQMGGKGNVSGMMGVMLSMMEQDEWKHNFRGFVIPYYFYGPEEYVVWLKKAGLRPVRVELIPKDMAHQGREGLAAWFRTTWHPFIRRIPVSLQQDFIDEAMDRYLREHPLDARELAHLDAVRLEVEAEKR